jgi:hypothetical protein
MVIVLHPGLNFRWMTRKGADERDTFGGDALSPRKISRWSGSRMTMTSWDLKFLKGVLPVARAIGIYSPESQRTMSP